MPNMEDSEADAPDLPAISDKKKSAPPPEICSPQSNILNQSPASSSPPAANSESARCAEQSTDRMPEANVETKPHPGGENLVVVDNNDDRGAAVGTKRKISKDERLPAKKARTSIELENKQEVPTSISMSMPTPTTVPPPIPNSGEAKSNTTITSLPDPIDKGTEKDQEKVGEHVFHFEYDENGYSDDADRQKLLQMSEMERKTELEDRIRRRAEKKQVWEANRRVEIPAKPAGEVSGEAEEGETDDTRKPGAVPQSALVRLNAKSEETVEKEEKVTKVGDSKNNNNNTGANNAATADSAGTVVSFVGRPFLRSSPIAITAKDSKDSTSPRASPTQSKDTITTTTGTQNTTTTTTATSAPAATSTTVTGSKKERSNKKRNVSWAKEDDLVQVVSIDNRMELIKSWDPESEITLPFTSLTLMQFRQAIASEAAADEEAANPGTTSQSDAFASPGNDADDEERRRRDCKAARQRKLDEMRPTIEWPQKGTQVVLPPECKPEEVQVKFTLHVEVDDGEVHASTEESYDSSYSPRSPPPDGNDQYPAGSAYEIPWTDPAAPRKTDTYQEQGAQQVPQHNNSNIYHSNGTGSGGVPQFRSQQQSQHHHQQGSYHQNQQQNTQYQQDMGMRGRDDHSRGGYNHNQNHNYNHQQRSPPQQYYQHPQGMNGGPLPPHMMNNNGYNHNHNHRGTVPVPDIPSVDLQSLLQALGGQSGAPPPPPPPSFPPPPPGYSNGNHGQYYPGPAVQMPMPPPPGRQMDATPHYALPPPQLAQKLMSGRSKIKKKCKYFGTKQGCRDGAACMFSHSP